MARQPTDLHGWYMWKGDEPAGLELAKNWHELFTGYADSLTSDRPGLREAARLVREKYGREAHPTAVVIVPDGEAFDCLGPVLRGTVCREALPWTHWKDGGPERNLASLAWWLSTQIEDARENRSRQQWRELFPEVIGWSEIDEGNLRCYGMFRRKEGDDMLPWDLRRINTLAKHRVAALDLMARVGLELMPLRFVRLPDDALPKDDEAWEARPGFLARMARSSRDYQWRFMDRCLEAGTLWFTPWNKSRREQGPDEWRDALLSGMDVIRWWTAHPEWFVIGEWDDARDARPIQLTDAGLIALADRGLYDLEPYSGGMIEPGWTAVPAEPGWKL